MEVVAPGHGPRPSGKAGRTALIVLLLLVRWLLSRLRPGRFVTKYSHVVLRVAHREHVGFSL